LVWGLTDTRDVSAERDPAERVDRDGEDMEETDTDHPSVEVE
jgi:hypothetical protein